MTDGAKRHRQNFYDGLMFLFQNGCPARYTNFINHSLCFGVRLFREQGDDHHCDKADGHADYAQRKWSMPSHGSMPTNRT